MGGRGIAVCVGVLMLGGPASAGAATVVGSGTLLTVVAEPGERNDIEVSSPSTGTVVVRELGSAPLRSGGARCVPGPDRSVVCDGLVVSLCDGLCGLRVTLGDRDDRIRVLDDLPLPPDRVLDGGPGNDRMELIGRFGIGALIGGSGDDVLLGGDGPDWFDGGVGDDVMRGRGGVDTVLYAEARRGVRVTLAGGADDGVPGERDDARAEAVEGSRHDDVIVGSDAANRLRGGGGADRLEGARGDDALFGDGGTDILDGGDGDDMLTPGVEAGSPARGDLVRCGGGTDAVQYVDPDVVTDAGCEVATTSAPFLVPPLKLGAIATSTDGRVLTAALTAGPDLRVDDRVTAALRLIGTRVLRAKGAPRRRPFTVAAGGLAVPAPGERTTSTLTTGRAARALLRRRGALRAAVLLSIAWREGERAHRATLRSATTLRPSS